MLICDGEMVIFRFKKLQVLEYIHHLNAYKVQIKNEIACIKQNNIQDFHPLGLMDPITDCVYSSQVSTLVERRLFKICYFRIGTSLGE